jgi:hypothetical protein
MLILTYCQPFAGRFIKLFSTGGHVARKESLLVNIKFVILHEEGSTTGLSTRFEAIILGHQGWENVRNL